MPDGVELEIAGICPGQGHVRRKGGIGVERVEMARTRRTPYWDSELDVLACFVQSDSKRMGAAEPPGAAAIAGTRA